MKKTVLEKVGEREEEYDVRIPPIFDENGIIVEEAKTEKRTKLVPIMKPITRDMTAEEEAEYLASQIDPRTRDEKISAEINDKYPTDKQIAILRQKDTKPQEYEEFFNFCESIKLKYPKGE